MYTIYNTDDNWEFVTFLLFPHQNNFSTQEFNIIVAGLNQSAHGSLRSTFRKQLRLLYLSWGKGSPVEYSWTRAVTARCTLWLRNWHYQTKTTLNGWQRPSTVYNPTSLYQPGLVGRVLISCTVIRIHHYTNFFTTQEFRTNFLFKARSDGSQPWVLHRAPFPPRKVQQSDLFSKSWAKRPLRRLIHSEFVGDKTEIRH